MATLTSLKTNDREYTKIKREFVNARPVTKIRSIIKIDMPDHITKKHEAYKKSKSTQRLYHGTKHYCDITKISSITKLCKNDACGVCGIIRHGPILRSGTGYIWFGGSPVISHGYTGSMSHSHVRAIFIMDVVAATNNHEEYIVPAGEAALPRYLVIYED